ncbi:strictosidine synthase [Mycolicibacterium canariasense]|uniref:Strictosidine synthase n=1 Tax=Mycolicibacterium canariasense TaxID=228230 RepID=A0A100WJ94_MYCCR|nr:SMP-30/gluconolactonase/LRE family protein [Mycolicibacterium canariasense]MCV7208135.1 SMP-30/gluconolactonase/LRE family protein [Mycolicibacterium canariasense]ORV09521.1 strictosidine synthase [Mycolicibacterium canariasense]GAS99121.1 strictosidine synthase [Mycolicibacterium canariasense]
MSAAPEKPAINPVRWQPPPVDPLPDYPLPELTLVPVPGHGPEDVVTDAQGGLWTGLTDGRIVRLGADGAVSVVADTGGRPLGMHVARDGRILVCDSHRGLLALEPSTGELTTLTSTVPVDGVGSASRGRPLRFCSNVTETQDGTIYFTESTSDYHYEWFRAAIMDARGTGGLYRLNSDGTVDTLAGGLYFANGLTVTADGSALVFAETQARRLSKYWLTGPQAGTVTPLAQHLPGMPDNICTGADGRIWVALVCPVNKPADWLAARPPVLRRVMWKLPAALQPQMPSEVWAVAFDPDSGGPVAGIHGRHPRFGQVTGLIERDGRLWLSTIGSDALAHCALPK